MALILKTYPAAELLVDGQTVDLGTVAFEDLPASVEYTVRITSTENPAETLGAISIDGAGTLVTDPSGLTVGGLVHGQPIGKLCKVRLDATTAGVHTATLTIPASISPTVSLVFTLTVAEPPPPPEPPCFKPLPDGASPMSETISSRCHAAEPSRNGTEAFACVRAYPRVTLSGSFTLLSGTPEAALDDLHAGGQLLVPAWMHPLVQLEGGGLACDAIYTGSHDAKPFMLRLVPGGPWAVVECPVVDSVLTLAEAYIEGYPMLPARLAEDSFSLEHITPTARKTGLSFTAFELNEQPGPAEAGAVGGYAVPGLLDGSQATGVQRSFAAYTFDEGGLTAWEKKFAKRSVKALVSLRTRAEVLAFRRFVYAVQGRSGVVSLRSPVDSVTRRYRLASDDVRLEYLKPSFARCELSLVETP